MSLSQHLSSKIIQDNPRTDLTAEYVCTIHGKSWNNFTCWHNVRRFSKMFMAAYKDKRKDTEEDFLGGSDDENEEYNESGQMEESCGPKMSPVFYHSMHTRPHTEQLLGSSRQIRMASQ